MNYKDIFQMPKRIKITTRSSSITNAFVSSVIPCIMPTENEIKEVLDILGMDIKNVRCAYCGGSCTEWDHFRPLVKGRKSTGYISEINNLVPSCNKCNGSKGNKSWRDWIESSARLSPRSRKTANLDIIIKRLEKYEAWSNPIQIDFESVIGAERLQEYWDNCEKIIQEMREAQKLAETIQRELKEQIQNLR